MDAWFIAVAGFGLVLLTFMTVVRLTGASVSRRRTALAVAELWAVIIAWVLLGWRGWALPWLSPLLAPRGFAVPPRLPTEELIRAGIADAIVIAAAVHFMWSMSRLGGSPRG